MGGCQSAEKAPSGRAVSPEKLSRADKHAAAHAAQSDVPSNKTSFVGFYDNLNLLCLDQFVSRYTGEMMHRWRPATITYMERDTGQVKVHYDGWKEKHDVWLNLKVDIRRFSFIEMLSEEQIKSGAALSEEQLAAMVLFAHTGDRPSAPVKPQNSKKNKPAKKVEFHVGQKVDIQDSGFKSKDIGKVSTKWRPGEIVDIQNNHVHVHYIGWGDEWDEVLDTSLEGHRIKVGGSKIVPRGTSRDTYKRQIIAASPSAKKQGGPAKDSAKIKVTRRRSLGEQGGNVNLDSLVSDKLAQQRQSKRGDQAASSPEPDISPTKPPKKGLSRNRSFPPLSYDADTQNEEQMFRMYEQQEKDYYAALQQEKDFVTSLNKKKMHVVEVDGDGNCLFRAVAHQIWLDEDRHLELRKRCVSHMKKHAKRYAAFYDGDFMAYLAKMSQPGQWGDDIEIRALEEVTDRLINIYSSHSDVIEPLKTNFDEVNLLQGVQPLKISYHGKNHYNSIFDETVCLPLEARSSSVLSAVRHKQLLG
mmetsp:Transcript_22360/g.37888  ORF Transcript_22360/g.37888 Transcript_22360/m.37888 type:complete len:527 (+) Transcript_22360:105-1685(+)